MADTWQAQDSFWNSFGLRAVDVNSEYLVDEIGFPHITYEAASGVLDQSANISVSLWYYSTSWMSISIKANEIIEAVRNGVVIPLDTGYLWIKLPENTPVASRMIGGNDDRYKRINLIFVVEFLK